MRESALSFHHVDPRARIQVVKLGGKPFYTLNHLPALHNHFWKHQHLMEFLGIKCDSKGSANTLGSRIPQQTLLRMSYGALRDNLRVTTPTDTVSPSPTCVGDPQEASSMNRCCLHLRNEISGALWGVLPSNAPGSKSSCPRTTLGDPLSKTYRPSPHLQGSGKKEVAPKANEFSGRK